VAVCDSCFGRILKNKIPCYFNNEISVPIAKNTGSYNHERTLISHMKLAAK
jgi:hypothetical protein